MPSLSHGCTSCEVRSKDPKGSNHKAKCTGKIRVVDEMGWQWQWLQKFVDRVVVAGICLLGVEDVLAEVTMAHIEEDGAWED